ncbi:hypothetical protein ADUPG1_013269, partial [Aduncisulcus paluster]
MSVLDVDSLPASENATDIQAFTFIIDLGVGAGSSITVANFGTSSFTTVFPFIFMDDTQTDLSTLSSFTATLTGTTQYEIPGYLSRNLYPVICSRDSDYTITMEIFGMSSQFVMNFKTMCSVGTVIVQDPVIDLTNYTLSYSYYITSFFGTESLAFFAFCYDDLNPLSNSNDVVALGREVSTTTLIYLLSSDSADVSSINNIAEMTVSSTNSLELEVAQNQGTFSVTTGTLGTALKEKQKYPFTFSFDEQLEGKNVSQDITCGLYVYKGSSTDPYVLDTSDSSSYTEFTKTSVTYASCEDPTRVLLQPSGLCLACNIGTKVISGACIDCDIFETCSSSGTITSWTGLDYKVSTMVYDSSSGDVLDMVSATAEFMYEILDETATTSLSSLESGQNFVIRISVNNTDVNPVINTGRGMDVLVPLWDSSYATKDQEIIDTNPSGTASYDQEISISLAPVVDGSGYILQGTSSTLQVKEIYERGIKFYLDLETSSNASLTINDPTSYIYIDVTGPSSIGIESTANATVTHTNTTIDIDSYLRFNYQPLNDFDISLKCDPSSLTSTTCTVDGSSQTFTCSYAIASNSTLDEQLLPYSSSCELEFIENGSTTSSIVQWYSGSGYTGNFSFTLD